MNRMLLFLIVIFSSQVNLYCNFKDDVNKGNKYYFKQKYEEALKKYNEAELRKPDSAIINFNSGDALYRQGQYEDAIKKYQKSLNLTKDKKFKSRILYNLGNANYKLQNIDQAKEYYKQSLVLDPNNSAAKYNLQQLLVLQQQEQKQDKKSKDKNDNKNNKNEQDKQKSDKEKNNNQEEKKKYMSKQDVERLLEMAEQQNKERQKVLKPQKPKLPDVEKDW